MSDESGFDLGGRPPTVTINDKYRTLFTSPLGREVLADLIRELHFGVTLNGSELQVAEYNVGIVILKKTGLLDDVEMALGIPGRGSQ